MADDLSTKTPPYASYRSFDNFLSHLREHPPLPSRIDKSSMSHLNYGTQQALFGALRFLGLLKDGDVPSTTFEDLVESQSDKDRALILKGLLESGYPYFFDGSLDLSRATLGQVVEKIRDEGGVSGSTVDKALAFFVTLAEAAGVSLSPHLRGKRLSTAPRKSNGQRKKIGKSDTASANKREDRPPPPTPPAASEDAWLAKFPPFDPSWSTEIQKSWFEGFAALMKLRKTGEKENGPS